MENKIAEVSLVYKIKVRSCDRNRISCNREACETLYPS